MLGYMLGPLDKTKQIVLPVQLPRQVESMNKALLQMFGFLDFWMFGFWIFGFLDVWMFGLLDVWVFDFLDVWNSAITFEREAPKNQESKKPNIQ